jgi:hypothetical protein
MKVTFITEIHEVPGLPCPQYMLEEAEHVLQDSKEQVAVHFDKASSLFENARWIHGAICMSETDVKGLSLVIDFASESYLKIEEVHQKVLRIQDELEPFEHSLREAFEEAHLEYRKLCGFPDGLFTRIRFFGRVRHEELHPGAHEHPHHNKGLKVRCPFVDEVREQ